MKKFRVARLINTSYSGSTLLSLVMDTHPKVVSDGDGINPRVFRKRPDQYPCSCGEAVINCRFWTRLVQSIQDAGFECSFQNWPLSHIYPNELKHKLLTSYRSNLLFRCFHSMASTLIPNHRKHIQNVNKINVAYVQAILAMTNSDVYFSQRKDLMSLQYLAKVPELDVKVVRMVRDVRAFVNSSKRKGRSIHDAIKTWKMYQLEADSLLKNFDSNKIFFLRYEDLCQDPTSCLRQLHEFLEIEIVKPPDVINPKDHHVLGNKMRLKPPFSIKLDEAWKSTLSKEEITQTLAEAGRINERLGYL